jgi:hypothetical protein
VAGERTGDITAAGERSIAIGEAVNSVIATGDVRIDYQGTAPADYRNEVAGLLAFHLDRAFGREQELDRVAQVAARREHGYLLIEAPGGYGKSTFAAQLVHRWETAQWPAPSPNLLFFFAREEGGRNTPLAFLQAVNSQLLRLLALPWGVPASLDELRVQFSALWSAALAATGATLPLLLLVDGLDEMAPGETTIADLLPGGLGDYGHVAVTSRPNPAAREQVEREHPLRAAEELRLETFDGRGVELLLRRYGADGTLAAELAPSVLRLTRGEPLFARFVAEEVGRDGSTALERLEQDPPADVEQYFHDELQRLREVAEEGEVAWDVLGLLAVALGGLRRVELAEALELPIRTVRRALDPIGRFLLVNADDAVEFFHRNLRAALVEGDEFTDSELSAYRDRLIGLCRRYQAAGWPEATPAYALVHYAEHLRAAGEITALLALPDRRWMRRHQESRRSLAGCARDVELALACADSGRPPVLAQEVRLCLIAATIGAVGTRIPAAVIGVLAEINRTKEAEEYAGLVQDPMSRSAAYRHLARALLRRGEGDAARAALAQALTAVERGQYETELAREDYHQVVEEVAPLARVLADAGDGPGLERLLAAADALGAARLPATASAALGLALAGRSERALELARRMLAQLGTWQELRGDVRDWDWVVVEATAPEMLLPAVAGVLAAAGEVERAAALADEALGRAGAVTSDGYRQASLLGAWTQALAEGPLRSRAQAAARDALDAAGRVQGRSAPAALRKAAEALSATGDAEGLERVLAAVASGQGSDSDYVLEAVASGLARLGRHDRAREAVDLMGEGWSRDDALADVVAGLAAASRFEEALAAAAAPRARWARTRALAAVAERFVEAGRTPEAATTADRAIKESERLDDEAQQAEAFGLIAAALLDAGVPDRALVAANRAGELLGALGPEGVSPSAVAVVVESLARLGRLDEALARTAALPGLEGLEADMLTTIGRAAHRAGRDDLVAGVTQRITALGDAATGTRRIEALLGLAELLAGVGRGEEAVDELGRAVELTLALEGREADRTPYLLASAAAAFARTGERGEAARVASMARVAGPREPDWSLDSARAVALEAAGLREDALLCARRALEAGWDRWPAGLSTEELMAALSVLPGDEAADWVRRISAASDQQPSGPERYWPLRGLALAWQRLGRSAEAVECLRASLRAARLKGARTHILYVLGPGAPILGEVDAGQTLWEVNEALVDVSAWWD